MKLGCLLVLFFSLCPADDLSSAAVPAGMVEEESFSLDDLEEQEAPAPALRDISFKQNTWKSIVPALLALLFIIIPLRRFEKPSASGTEEVNT